MVFSEGREIANSVQSGMYALPTLSEIEDGLAFFVFNREVPGRTLVGLFTQKGKTHQSNMRGARRDSIFALKVVVPSFTIVFITTSFIRRESNISDTSSSKGIDFLFSGLAQFAHIEPVRKNTSNGGKPVLYLSFHT